MQSDHSRGLIQVSTKVAKILMSHTDTIGTILTLTDSEKTLDQPKERFTAFGR